MLSQSNLVYKDVKLCSEFHLSKVIGQMSNYFTCRERYFMFRIGELAEASKEAEDYYYSFHYHYNYYYYYYYYL